MCKQLAAHIFHIISLETQVQFFPQSLCHAVGYIKGFHIPDRVEQEIFILLHMVMPSQAGEKNQKDDPQTVEIVF